mgnify:FL=1
MLFRSSFNKTTGVFSGTPTAVTATTNYVVTATNLAGTDTETVTLTVNPAAPTALNYIASASYQVGDPVSITPSFTGEAVTFSVSPALPSGLSLNTSSGVISGTAGALSPAADYVVTMSNATGSLMDTINITVAFDDYNTWTYSASFNLNTTSSAANVSSGLGRFPVLVRLSNAHRSIFQQALAGGADIRFANGSGAHLPYQIERWSAVTGDTGAAIWVLADTVSPNNTTTVNMYWGNASAPSRSNSAKVFDTANGYQAVWHMSAGDTTGEVDATSNGYNLSSPATASARPTSTTSGAVGLARSFATA